MSKLTSGIVICWITAPTNSVAESLAKSLVQERLVACVNIIPKIRSVYSWEGKVCTDDEVLLMAKTKSTQIENISVHLKQNHPYEVPELISTRIESGLPAYFEWVNSVIKDEN